MSIIGLQLPETIDVLGFTLMVNPITILILLGMPLLWGLCLWYWFTPKKNVALRHHASYAASRPYSHYDTPVQEPPKPEFHYYDLSDGAPPVDIPTLAPVPTSVPSPTAESVPISASAFEHKLILDVPMTKREYIDWNRYIEGKEVGAEDEVEIDEDYFTSLKPAMYPGHRNLPGDNVLEDEEDTQVLESGYSIPTL